MKYLIILLLLFLLASCSSPVDSFEGEIWDMKSNTLLVDCSSTVNRDAEGDIPSVAYLCNVEVTEDTVITNANSEQININDLKEEQFVQIILDEEKDISPKNRDVTAAEIIVLN
ncbi:MULTISPECIES: hypothetical protein [Planococcaceae]|uniref:hypothetical protein n=1 Tax=Caryophanaceae TaxID=186818 RepID=UPI000EF4E895|nr:MULTISPECIES: hypothetical protein [Planococcaceae]QHJ70033.1 hypothetical protein DNR44_005210 [Planococcus halotolerans]RLQ90093.1 hypothetical protein D9754_10140 [Planomicrobium sp. Y74]